MQQAASPQELRSYFTAVLTLSHTNRQLSVHQICGYSSPSSFLEYVLIISQCFPFVKVKIRFNTEINFGDYWYQFVGAAFGSPYNNAEYQEDRRRRPLQFLSYIRPIILKIDLRAADSPFNE